ncbi:MAG: UDP-3-O-(3-hydroxymyristoyl)glucosamine N-acyltransferase, partial [Bryobacterales bacterium]|nr:UDP-3-O-(3-hydroxymyristoyl)glucosamine N-acyltransferase [Bryobacterales bacterium]
MRVRELADWLGCTFEGDGERELSGVSGLESAGADQVSFIGNRKAAAHADQSAAGCLLVPLDYANQRDRTVIRTADPLVMFARTVALFHPLMRPAPGVHPTAVVAADVELGRDVSIGPNTSIGEGCRIGDRCVI